MTRVTSAVAREIKQRRPFRSKGQEGAVALLRTADFVRRHLGAVVERHGITLQQYNVLRILRGAGDEGLPTLEIAERMVEEAPGITRLMDRLEAKAVVRRERCPRDRRQVLCWIAPKGLKLLLGLDPLMLDTDRALFGTLGRGDLDRLIHLLDAVRRAPPRVPAAVSRTPAAVRFDRTGRAGAT